MRKLILIFFLPIIICSQNRYNLSQIIKPNDGKVVKEKSTMKPINGFVFCKWGDIGEYINGKPVGTHRFWNTDGQLENIINYSNLIYSCEATYLYSFLSKKTKREILNTNRWNKGYDDFDYWKNKVKKIEVEGKENECSLIEQTKFNEGELELELTCLNDECSEFLFATSDFELSFFRKNDKKHKIKRSGKTVFGFEKKWSLKKVNIFYENGQLGYSFSSELIENENNKEIRKWYSNGQRKFEKIQNSLDHYKKTWYDDGKEKLYSNYLKKYFQKWHKNGELHIDKNQKNIFTWYENGRISSFFDEKKHMSWYPDGRIKEILDLNEKNYKSFSKSGSLTCKISFSNNVQLKDLKDSFFENEDLNLFETFSLTRWQSNDKKFFGNNNYIFEEWNSNGDQIIKVSFGKSNKLKGKLQYWHSNGQLAFDGFFVDGDPHDNIIVFDINGETLYNGVYDDGSEVGTHFSVNDIGHWIDWLNALNASAFEGMDEDNWSLFYSYNDYDEGPTFFEGNIYELVIGKDQKSDRKYIESSFYKGRLNGVLKSWYDSKKTNYFSKIEYKRGKKNGISYWYWPNGVLRSEITFSYNLPKYMKCYDKYGNKMSCF